MGNLRIVLTKVLHVLTGISFLAMVGLTFWQVVMRYVFAHPITWSEELVSYLFAWASLLGACLVTGERGHMNIPIIGNYLGEGAKKTVAIFGEVMGVLFSLIILYYGGHQIAELSMGQMTSSLGVPLGVFYVLLPVAGVVNALYGVLNIRDIATGQMPAFVND